MDPKLGACRPGCRAQLSFSRYSPNRQNHSNEWAATASSACKDFTPCCKTGEHRLHGLVNEPLFVVGLWCLRPNQSTGETTIIVRPLFLVVTPFATNAKSLFDNVASIRGEHIGPDGSKPISSDAAEGVVDCATERKRRRGRVARSLGDGSLHVPEVMADLVRVALHNVKRTDGAVVGVRCRDVARSFERRGAPGLGGGDQCDESYDR
jgi:hypothetical protein